MAKRQGAEFWRGHLEAWRHSELTQLAYCASHGLGIKSFSRWRRRETEEARSARSSLALVPVGVGTPATGSVVRLHSPGGWRIELPGCGEPWLVDLLRRLP